MTPDQRRKYRARFVVEVKVDDMDGRRMAEFFGQHDSNRPGLVCYCMSGVRARKFKLLRSEGFKLAESFHPKVPLFCFRDVKMAKLQMSQAVAMAEALASLRNELKNQNAA